MMAPPRRARAQRASAPEPEWCGTGAAHRDWQYLAAAEESPWPPGPTDRHGAVIRAAGSEGHCPGLTEAASPRKAAA